MLAGAIGPAWVLAQGEHRSHSGTKRVRYLEDNMGALHVRLNADELAQIDKLFPPGIAEGERYAEPMMALVNR